MRKTLLGYSMLPNYQNYWIEAGYEEEIGAVRNALKSGEQDKIPSIMSERWLSDVTLYGSPRRYATAWRPGTARA